MVPSLEVEGVGSVNMKTHATFENAISSVEHVVEVDNIGNKELPSLLRNIQTVTSS